MAIEIVIPSTFPANRVSGAANGDGADFTLQESFARAVQHLTCARRISYPAFALKEVSAGSSGGIKLYIHNDLYVKACVLRGFYSTIYNAEYATVSVEQTSPAFSAASIQLPGTLTPRPFELEFACGTGVVGDFGVAQVTVTLGCVAGAVKAYGASGAKARFYGCYFEPRPTLEVTVV